MTSTTRTASGHNASSQGFVWSQPSVKHSWFKNAEGKFHVLGPRRLVDYRTWTNAPGPNDFVVR